MPGIRVHSRFSPAIGRDQSDLSPTPNPKRIYEDRRQTLPHISVAIHSSIYFQVTNGRSGFFFIKRAMCRAHPVITIGIYVQLSGPRKFLETNFYDKFINLTTLWEYYLFRNNIPDFLTESCIPQLSPNKEPVSTPTAVPNEKPEYFAGVYRTSNNPE